MLIDYIFYFIISFSSFIFYLYVLKIDSTLSDIDNELYEIKKYIRDINKNKRK